MLKSIKKLFGYNPMHKYKEILSKPITDVTYQNIIYEILGEYKTEEELEKAIKYLNEIRPTLEKHGEIRYNDTFSINNLETNIDYLQREIRNKLKEKIEKKIYKTKIINEDQIERAFNKSLLTEEKKLRHFSLKKKPPNIPPPQSIVENSQLLQSIRPKTKEENRRTQLLSIRHNNKKGGKKKRKTRKNAI